MYEYNQGKDRTRALQSAFMSPRLVSGAKMHRGSRIG